MAVVKVGCTGVWVAYVTAGLGVVGQKIPGERDRGGDAGLGWVGVQG